MKTCIIILFAFIFSMQSYGQSLTQNNLSVVYGLSATSVNIHGVIGDYGYKTKTGNLLGFNYTRKVNSFFSLQTGILFSNNKVELSSIYAGGETITDGSVKVLSIPLLARFNFWKFMFATGGLSIDKQTNYNPYNYIVQNQSGLGGELGFGANINIGKVNVFANPYFKQYAITRTSNNVIEIGVKFGAGYNF